MTIQQRLDELSPYVTTIRYGKTPIVEVEFPAGWGVPKSGDIEFKAVNEMKESDTLQCVAYSENPKHNVDSLLDFIERAIKLNKEREMKNELFKEKVSELKNLFNKTELSKLKSLKFTFPEDYMELDSNYELDNEVVEDEKVIEEPEEKQDEPEVKKPINEVVVEEPTKNGKPVLAEFDAPPCNCKNGESCPSCIDY